MLETFRVVHLGGARQVGKTTLVRDLLPLPGGSTVTLDDEALLLRARDDAAGFLAAVERPARIDEFQRAGEGLLLAVKAAADKAVEFVQDGMRLGLGTGSTAFIMVKRLAERVREHMFETSDYPRDAAPAVHGGTCNGEPFCMQSAPPNELV